MQKIWHTKTIPQVLLELRSSEHGLTADGAKRRLEEYGPNKLPEAKADGLAVIFLRQFQSPLIYILLAAALIVFIIGEKTDSFIILAVLLFNAIVGTIQEGRAQNTLLALKNFTETKATVLRDKKEIIISDTELVPGDIVILQEGEKIPADIRIIVSSSIQIDESSLTGESLPILKTTEALANEKLPAADQKNMLFKGTNIVSGNGRGVVVLTGLETEIGKIAKEISTIDVEIPLKTNIRNLSKLIIIAVAIIGVILFFSGILLDKSAKEMFLTVVSLSVSIIPEGLPIVITLVLATGVWRMSKKNVLVKKLQAVETLGQARIIAVDKTGTITKNEIMIEKVYVDGNFFEIGGAGYDPEGDISLGGRVIDPLNHPELLFAGKIAAFCANARVVNSGDDKQWRVTGDPTEASMLVLARKIGFQKDSLERESPLVAEIPFDYRLKYHATLHKVDGQNFLKVVGAPEVVLSLSKKIWRGGKEEILSEEEKIKLESVVAQMSELGLRVIAFGGSYDVYPPLLPEKNTSLTFFGFFGMKDTLRPEVADAMKMAISAGMKVVMITGDHKITATAIALEAGIYHKGDIVLTGQEIDDLSDFELKGKIAKVSVFARVTPEHKLRIVNAYKARGEIIAMTGDGVNDAPSLVAADLGVAMGKIGTEVTKEASDIILLDDNFGSIILAVEEGRSIYKTIKKVILYLFSTNVGEVLTIAGALFLGFPLPLLAAQIIWLNFVTDGFLDVALAMEPKEKGLLRGNFERPKKYLIDKLMFRRMIFMALPMAIGTLYLFAESLSSGGGSALGADPDLTKAWTISLTTLACFQWFNAWNCRSEDKSIFAMNPFSNKFLIGATAIVITLQLAALHTPFLQKILHTTPLSLSEWLIIIPIAGSIILVEEARKFFYRRKLASAIPEIL